MVEDFENADGGGKIVRIVFHAAVSEKDLGTRQVWTAKVRVRGKEGRVELLGDS